MLGRPGRLCPVCMKVVAGSWFTGLVLTERIVQTSSTMRLMWGSSSLVHDPLPPCCLNSYWVLMTGWIL